MGTAMLDEDVRELLREDELWDCLLAREESVAGSSVKVLDHQ